jgi:hypothetical protein
MSIRVSIYDFFAYTIPGGIILAIVLYINQRYQVFSLSFADLSLLELIGIGVLAYLVGFLIDPISKDLWYRFFCPKNLHQTTLNDFNKRHPNIEIPFQKMDWYVSFAYIKRFSVEMVQELEHLKVINIMLRNSSFGLTIFGVVFAFEFVTRHFVWVYAVASVLCVTTGIVLVKQAVKFSQWFYEGIFQSLVALLSDPQSVSITSEKKTRTTSMGSSKEKEVSIK